MSVRDKSRLFGAENERQQNLKLADLKGLEKKRDALELEIEKLYANIDEELLDFIKKKDKLDTLIEAVNSRISARNQRINELSEREKEADQIVIQIDFAKAAVQHLRKRKEELIDAVRITFNKRIKEIYQKLGYKDFDDIEIRPDYSIYIRRPTYNEAWPLDALSTSEKVTLAVALLIAGKEEYLPDYPFFVLDELVTSYDPERFSKIKDYISKVTDYVIITQLATAKETGGKVLVEYA